MADKLTISSEESVEVRIALRRTLPRDASRPPEPESGAVGGEEASELLGRLMMLGRPSSRAGSRPSPNSRTG
ncbi:hypothetical protein OG946_26240 [Streptomyces sp. NBC_01808]|uniref:hypothetical protein n=1 Tax=Streptomyces sp. NBC_01808 TaxID=2975947 RepID=UPI002DD7E930|nr:hypothetical protein [Streptomyces sp. NBC_01808]WSA40564.1 hypothetical protein OG946_26240 [Streptomyces sp. NBC_01808]